MEFLLGIVAMVAFFMCLPFIACIIKEVLCAYDKWIDFVCDAIYRRKSDDE